VKYWLLKSEPDTFSITDLKARPRRTEHWDGVRNYQARNYIREMQKGDHAFFYHSSCAEPGVVGTVTVVSDPYPDFTAFDPHNPHYDPKSTPDHPRWFMVDVRHDKTFRNTVGLQQLKECRELTGFALLNRGNRLSIMPVTASQWRFINSLAGEGA